MRGAPLWFSTSAIMQLIKSRSPVEDVAERIDITYSPLFVGTGVGASKQDADDLGDNHPGRESFMICLEKILYMEWLQQSSIAHRLHFLVYDRTGCHDNNGRRNSFGGASCLYIWKRLTPDFREKIQIKQDQHRWMSMRERCEFSY